MLDLKTPRGTASTIPEKTQALYEQFYPTVEANIDDILDTTFADDTSANPLPSVAKASLDEVRTAIRRQKAGKASGSDGIATDFLKAMGEPLVLAIASLLTASWNAGYYPARFREARTIVLKKPGKGVYHDPKAWRPIALLSTIGKVMETVTAKRIQTLAEEHRLLPGAQMGARKGRSVETALELLVEQVHTIWGTGNNVATLLSMDVLGAYDTVNATRLLDVLR